MKGFIDLAFEHGGRYYLVDWKSNRLGPAREDYHRDRLDAVMREHFYRLQYHIYTLALHQCLRAGSPGMICAGFRRGVLRVSCGVSAAPGGRITVFTSTDPTPLSCTPWGRR